MSNSGSLNRDNNSEELSTEELEEPPKSIVEVRQAYKKYSPNAVILNGLNMTVQKGTM